MRTVTYNAGAYLVEELQRAGVVAYFHHDGGDILLFELWGGQKVSIHLIESSIELYEIRQTLAHNQAQGIHTLFIVWGDRLLPGDGQSCALETWMSALLALYGERIYAYDIYGSEIFVFPVHFEGYGYERVARFGTTVNMAHLGCASVGTSAAGFTGVWRVARFRVGRFEGARQRYDQRTEETQPETASTPLQKYYAALGVDADVERDALRKAYRLLARRYHPDVNKAPGATARMQQINEAYAALLALLADDGEARA